MMRINVSLLFFVVFFLLVSSSVRGSVMSTNDDMEDNVAATVDNNITQPRRSKRATIPSKRLADFIVKPGRQKRSVMYDDRAIVINGKRRILISGSIHYPRSTPEVGLKGEMLSLNTLCGCSSVKWVKDLLTQKHPMTWYKATFDAPEGNDPLALDMGSMGKGQIWINGEGVGLHWPGYIACGDCGECNCAGLYSETKCQTNCEQPSQRWYLVPRSWLKPRGNLLVAFEEWGGDPAGISLARRSTTRVCADTVEGQPRLKRWHVPTSGKSNSLRLKAHLLCPAGLKISNIQFASYGLPQGTCGNYHEGSCHAHKSNGAFEKDYIGQQSCSVNVVPEVFGGDPCPNTSKKLAVEAICS